MAVLDSQRGSGWGLAAALLGARGTPSSAFGKRGYSGSGNGGDDGDDNEWEGGPGEAKDASMVSTRAVLSLPYFTDTEN